MKYYELLAKLRRIHKSGGALCARCSSRVARCNRCLDLLEEGDKFICNYDAFNLTIDYAYRKHLCYKCMQMVTNKQKAI